MIEQIGVVGESNPLPLHDPPLHSSTVGTKRHSLITDAHKYGTHTVCYTYHHRNSF